jgi:hypothetical protein
MNNNEYLSDMHQICLLLKKHEQEIIEDSSMMYQLLTYVKHAKYPDTIEQMYNIEYKEEI